MNTKKRNTTNDLDPDIQFFLKTNGFKKVNGLNAQGQTPLITAIYADNFAIFQKLLQLDKINVNFTDKNNRTAVWWAARFGLLDHLKVLSEKKADFTVADKDGSTPLFESIKNKFHRAAAFIIYHITGFSI